MPGSKVVKVVLSESMWDRTFYAAKRRDQTVSEFIRSAIRECSHDQDARIARAAQTIKLANQLPTEGE